MRKAGSIIQQGEEEGFRQAREDPAPLFSPVTNPGVNESLYLVRRFDSQDQTGAIPCLLCVGLPMGLWLEV